MKRDEQIPTRTARFPFPQASAGWAWAVAWAVALAMWGVPTWASALECKVPSAAAPDLARVDPEARIAFIAQTLSETARKERRFALGWSLSYVGLSAGTWLFVPLSSDPRQWVESAFNSGTSAFAALIVLVGPVGVIRDQQRLDRLLSQAGPGGDRCALLVQSERLLLHAADSEQSARSAFAHLSGVAFNLGLGLVLGYGLERPAAAALNTSIGIVLGELMIMTRPTHAIRGLERYRAGKLRAESEPQALSFVVTPMTMGSGYGVGFAGHF